MRITNTAAITCVVTLLASFNAFADSQSPSTPTNVNAESVDGSSIIVSWNTPFDDVGVDGYNVYRNGSYYSTIYGSTNYIDRNTNSGTAYQYAVVAFDAARNYSTLSATASANSSGASTSGAVSGQNVAAGTPAAPGNLSVNAIDNSSARVSWNAPSGGATGYNVYQNGSYISTVKGGTEYVATSLNNGSNYSFYIVSIRGNNYSGRSSSVSFTMNGGSGASATTQSNAGSSPPPQNSGSTGSNSSNVASGYQLVFSDEFNGGGINSARWNTSYRWGPNWTINNEEQYYVDTLNNPGFDVSPFSNDGSNLTISATRTPDYLRGRSNGKSYLSGAMTTYGKFRMTYGYVEMRAKLPRGKGLWPAFWLLHEADDKNKPEIDIMENLGSNTSVVYQTYHFFNNGNLQSTPTYQASGADYASDFHTYGMKWEPGRITWYVDGVATNTYASGNVPSESMYILVNLALGGSWAGSPDGSTPFPANFQIDYIRAYQ